LKGGKGFLRAKDNIHIDMSNVSHKYGLLEQSAHFLHYTMKFIIDIATNFTHQYPGILPSKVSCTPRQISKTSLGHVFDFIHPKSFEDPARVKKNHDWLHDLEDIVERLNKVSIPLESDFEDDKLCRVQSKDSIIDARRFIQSLAKEYSKYPTHFLAVVVDTLSTSTLETIILLLGGEVHLTSFEEDLITKTHLKKNRKKAFLLVEDSSGVITGREMKGVKTNFMVVSTLVDILATSIDLSDSLARLTKRGETVLESRKKKKNAGQSPTDWQKLSLGCQEFLKV
jgi:hypothetical protein